MDEGNRTKRRLLSNANACPVRSPIHEDGLVLCVGGARPHARPTASGGFEGVVIERRLQLSHRARCGGSRAWGGGSDVRGGVFAGDRLGVVCSGSGATNAVERVLGNVHMCAFLFTTQ